MFGAARSGDADSLYSVSLLISRSFPFLALLPEASQCSSTVHLERRSCQVVLATKSLGRVFISAIPMVVIIIMIIIDPDHHDPITIIRTAINSNIVLNICIPYDIIAIIVTIFITLNLSSRYCSSPVACSISLEARTMRPKPFYSSSTEGSLAGPT